MRGMSDSQVPIHPEQQPDAEDVSTSVLIEVPGRAKLYRRFHHSILVPFFEVDARSLENIAINPTDNDICLAAADVCVSCFHFIEHARHEDRELAQAFESFAGLAVLSDIANTRKHLVRHKAARQVQLIGRLAFEIAADSYGFIRTEVVAIGHKGQETDVLRLIFEFIEFVRAAAGFGPPMDVGIPRPRVYLSSCQSRITYKTVAMEQSSYSFYRRNSDGSLRKAEEGLSVPLEVVPDIGESHTIGRFKLNHDLPSIMAWFDD